MCVPYEIPNITLVAKNIQFTDASCPGPVKTRRIRFVVKSCFKLEIAPSACADFVKVESMRSQRQLQWVVARVTLQVDGAGILGNVRRRGRDCVAAADIILGADVNESKSDGR